MKKILVMGSGQGTNFEAIVRWFQNKDVEITCISDVEDAPILQKAKNAGVSAKFVAFEENEKFFSEYKFDLVALAGYMKVVPAHVLALMGKVVNLHPSLLPSFKGKEAINQAFLAGVKVSGITIHWVEKEVDEGKIIAQYPVFIDNSMRLDEFEEEIHTIEHKLYPIVIEKLLEDKVFDFQDLMPKKQEFSCNNKGCGGHSSEKNDDSSGGCKGCCH